MGAPHAGLASEALLIPFQCAGYSLDHNRAGLARDRLQAFAGAFGHKDSSNASNAALASSREPPPVSSSVSVTSLALRFSVTSRRSVDCTSSTIAIRAPKGTSVVRALNKVKARLDSEKKAAAPAAPPAEVQLLLAGREDVTALVERAVIVCGRRKHLR